MHSRCTGCAATTTSTHPPTSLTFPHTHTRNRPSRPPTHILSHRRTDYRLRRPRPRHTDTDQTTSHCHNLLTCPVTLLWSDPLTHPVLCTVWLRLGTEPALLCSFLLLNANATSPRSSYCRVSFKLERGGSRTIELDTTDDLVAEVILTWACVSPYSSAIYARADQPLPKAPV